MEHIKKLFSDTESVTIKDRIYTIKQDSLTANGHKAGDVYVISDETEHFRYMQELEEQRNIADRANQAKSSFLANMSHEIRTPINAVLGLDEMILRESGEENVKAYAHDIMSSGKSLLAIINDILDLSKIEAGKMEIINSVYDLRGMLNDLCTMMELRAKGKSLQFNVTVNEETPYRLFGDETRIRQCVLNILTNAVKYTHTGSVNMDVGFKKINDSKISLSFCVTDTGIGIKKEDIEKLNKPFERIEESRNRSIEGSGLGMSITSGFEDYISKPVNSAKLEAVMSRYLPAEKMIHEGDEGFVVQKAKDGEKSDGSGVSDELFKKMFGIDICEAVKNCGNMDIFMDAVNIFWDSIEEKSEKTEQYAE